MVLLRMLICGPGHTKWVITNLTSGRNTAASATATVPFSAAAAVAQKNFRHASHASVCGKKKKKKLQPFRWSAGREGGLFRE